VEIGEIGCEETGETGVDIEGVGTEMVGGSDAGTSIGGEGNGETLGSGNVGAGTDNVGGGGARPKSTDSSSGLVPRGVFALGDSARGVATIGESLVRSAGLGDRLRAKDSLRCLDGPASFSLLSLLGTHRSILPSTPRLGGFGTGVDARRGVGLSARLGAGLDARRPVSVASLRIDSVLRPEIKDESLLDENDGILPGDRLSPENLLENRLEEGWGSGANSTSGGGGVGGRIMGSICGVGVDSGRTVVAV
jgi:hypothetical protein